MDIIMGNPCCHREAKCTPFPMKKFIEVGVVLTMGELFYDVEFVTNRIAKTNVVDGEGNTTKLASSVSAEGEKNREYINRLIESSVKKLRSRTSWASGERGGKVVNDMIPPHICDWTFVFHLPLDWRGEADVLCSLCHDYVKNKVITDWLKMVAPKLAGDYESQADENLRDLQYELRKEKSEMPTRIYDLTS
jgi:hypothetical protein